MSGRAFDSDEEMWAQLWANMKAADANVGPEANLYKPGDFFARLMPEIGMIVYGEILDSVEQTRACGGTDEEVEWEQEMRADPAMQHYRFTRSYSEVCPKGELGDQHVSVISTTLTAEEFERARSLEWPCDPMIFFEEVLKVLLPAKGTQA